MDERCSGMERTRIWGGRGDGEDEMMGRTRGWGGLEDGKDEV